VLLVLLALVVAVVGCSPAIERPLSGAAPGHAAPTATSAVPPTLSPDPRFKALVLPSPSPALALSPAPAAAASPSPATAPPIVRTISPSTNASVPAGPPVAISAVLVGRGADLAGANLIVDGADTAAQPDKRAPRDWSIHATLPLSPGDHTAIVRVRDESGAAGGYTWHFSVGEASHGATPTPGAQPQRTPQPTAERH
jgi:hypothetical protein